MSIDEKFQALQAHPQWKNLTMEGKDIAARRLLAKSKEYQAAKGEQRRAMIDHYVMPLRRNAKAPEAQTVAGSFGEGAKQGFGATLGGALSGMESDLPSIGDAISGLAQQGLSGTMPRSAGEAARTVAGTVGAVGGQLLDPASLGVGIATGGVGGHIAGKLGAKGLAQIAAGGATGGAAIGGAIPAVRGGSAADIAQGAAMGGVLGAAGGWAIPQAPGIARRLLTPTPAAHQRPIPGGARPGYQGPAANLMPSGPQRQRLQPVGEEAPPNPALGALVDQMDMGRKGPAMPDLGIAASLPEPGPTPLIRLPGGGVAPMQPPAPVPLRARAGVAGGALPAGSLGISPPGAIPIMRPVQPPARSPVMPRGAITQPVADAPMPQPAQATGPQPAGPSIGGIADLIKATGYKPMQPTEGDLATMGKRFPLPAPRGLEAAMYGAPIRAPRATRLLNKTPKTPNYRNIEPPWWEGDAAEWAALPEDVKASIWADPTNQAEAPIPYPEMNRVQRAMDNDFAFAEYPSGVPIKKGSAAATPQRPLPPAPTAFSAPRGQVTPQRPLPPAPIAFNAPKGAVVRRTAFDDYIANTQEEAKAAYRATIGNPPEGASGPSPGRAGKYSNSYEAYRAAYDGMREVMRLPEHRAHGNAGRPTLGEVGSEGFDPSAAISQLKDMHRRSKNPVNKLVIKQAIQKIHDAEEQFPGSTRGEWDLPPKTEAPAPAPVQPAGAKDLSIADAIIGAVDAHPSTLSPVALEALLRGESIGRMSEKGLLGSPFFGALKGEKAANIGREISKLVESGELSEEPGFYNALKRKAGAPVQPAGAAKPLYQDPEAIARGKEMAKKAQEFYGPNLTSGPKEPSPTAATKELPKSVAEAEAAGRRGYDEAVAKFGPEYPAVHDATIKAARTMAARYKEDVAKAVDVALAYASNVRMEAQRAQDRLGRKGAAEVKRLSQMANAIENNAKNGRPAEALYAANLKTTVVEGRGEVSYGDAPGGVGAADDLIRAVRQLESGNYMDIVRDVRSLPIQRGGLTADGAKTLSEKFNTNAANDIGYFLERIGETALWDDLVAENISREKKALEFRASDAPKSRPPQQTQGAATVEPITGGLKIKHSGDPYASINVTHWTKEKNARIAQEAAEAWNASGKRTSAIQVIGRHLMDARWAKPIMKMMGEAKSITGKDVGFTVGTMPDGSPAISDGYIAIRGTPPEGAKKSGSTFNGKIFPTEFKHGESSIPVFLEASGGASHDMVAGIKFGDGGYAFFDVKKLASLKKHLPNATLKMNTPDGPVGIFSGDKLEGLIMPFKGDDNLAKRAAYLMGDEGLLKGESGQATPTGALLAAGATGAAGLAAAGHPVAAAILAGGAALLHPKVRGYLYRSTPPAPSGALPGAPGASAGQFTPWGEAVGHGIRAGMLASGPMLLRNAASTGGEAVFRGAARPLAAAIDMAAAPLLSGGRSIQGARLGQTARSLAVAARSYPRDFWDIMTNKPRSQAQQQAMGKWLDKPVVTRFPLADALINGAFRLPAAGDVAFRRFAFHRWIEEASSVETKKWAASQPKRPTSKQIADYRKNLRENPTPEMQREASLAADYATFQDETELGKMGLFARDKIKDWGEKAGGNTGRQIGAVVADSTIPFSSTPGSVTTRIVDRMFLGVPKATRAVLQARAAGKWSKQDQRMLVEAISEGVLAQALVYLGYKYGSEWLTAPYDPARAPLDSAEGRQSSSVRVGDRWLKIGNLGPMYAHLIEGAAIREAQKERGTYSKASKAGKLMVEGALDTPMAEFVEDVAHAKEDPARAAMGALGSRAAMLVPATVAQIAQARDTKERQVDPFKPWERAQSRIPGLREALPEKVSGRGRTPEQTIIGTKATDTPATRELRRLGIPLSTQAKTLDVGKRKSGDRFMLSLPMELQQGLYRAQQRATIKALEHLVTRAAYARASDDAKAAAIRKKMAITHEQVLEAWKTKRTPELKAAIKEQRGREAASPPDRSAP